MTKPASNRERSRAALGDVVAYWIPQTPWQRAGKVDAVT